MYYYVIFLLAYSPPSDSDGRTRAQTAAHNHLVPLFTRLCYALGAHLTERLEHKRQRDGVIVISLNLSMCFEKFRQTQPVFESTLIVSESTKVTQINTNLEH